MLGGVTERMSLLSFFFLCSRSDWIKVKHCYYLTSSPVPVLGPASTTPSTVTDVLLIGNVCLLRRVEHGPFGPSGNHSVRFPPHQGQARCLRSLLGLRLKTCCTTHDAHPRTCPIWKILLRQPLNALPSTKPNEWLAFCYYWYTEMMPPLPSPSPWAKEMDIGINILWSYSFRLPAGKWLMDWCMQPFSLLVLAGNRQGHHL